MYSSNVLQYSMSDLHEFDDAAAQAGIEGGFEWKPTGLKVFEIGTPDVGGDVEAIKRGHVSVTALRTGFLAAKAAL